MPQAIYRKLSGGRHVVPVHQPGNAGREIPVLPVWQNHRRNRHTCRTEIDFGHQVSLYLRLQFPGGTKLFARHIRGDGFFPHTPDQHQEMPLLINFRFPHCRRIPAARHRQRFWRHAVPPLSWKSLRLSLSPRH